MDQSGRFRSRIGKPSGLRPPSVRGAAAAAGPCPALQGTAPCPATEKTGPSRLQQILRPARSLRPPTVRGAAAAADPCPAVQGTSPCLAAERAGPSRLPQIPRPASGLRPPTVRRAAAAAGPCPSVQGTAPCPAAERTGLSRLQQISRPASRLPDPRLQRTASPPRVPSPSRGAIPKRTGLRPPSGYAASSRLPAAPRPARVIPQPEPTPEAPIASTVPVARVVSPAPRATSPARTLAVPISQDSPGAAAAICPAAVATPLRRRLPQPSRLRRPAAKTENVVAVPVVQAPGSPLKRILIPESVAASDEETIVAVPRVTPLEQVDRKFAEMERRLSLEGAAAPCSPRSPRVRRSAPYAISEEALETTLNRIDAPKPVPVIEVPVTPREAAAVINQVVENAATALVEQEKEEEGTEPFYYLTRSPGFADSAFRLLLSPEIIPPNLSPAQIPTQPILNPATMSYIDAKWDRLMRDSYGDEYADSLLAERLPLSPVVPAPIPSFLDRLGATMPPKEDTVMPKNYSLSSEGEQVSPKRSVRRRLVFEDENLPSSSPRVRRSAPYAISEEALETTLNRIDEPKPVPVIEVPVTPREAAAVINQVVENAATAVVEQEKEEEGTESSYYLARSPGFADRAFRLLLSPEIPTSLPTPILDPFTMGYIDSKWDRLMRDSYGDEYADSLAVRPPLSPIVPDPIPSFLDSLGATMPPKEDTVMPKYYSLSSEQVSPGIDPEAAFVLASIVEAVAQVEESDDELIEDITPPPEFFEPDAAEGLPRPLIPQRVWPRSKGRIVPKLGSPLGERSRYPVAYLKMLSGYKSPKYIDSPFSNPPKNPPYHKYLDRYITIDELEAFLAGTWPELEEEKVERGIWAETTPPEDTHSEYFDTRFYDRYPGYRRYERY